MARRRFFVDGIHHGHAEVTGDEAHHLVRVLRVEPGQRYEISDGAGGVYLATVAEARKSRVLFDVEERVALKPLPLRITLAFALIKFDRLEWILEKGTEAGVETFIPVIAERSEKGLEQAAPKRRERWERIVIEASQQSRRDKLPALLDPVRLRDLRCEGGLRLLLDEDPAAPPMLSVLPVERNPGDEVALLLGPEGGWTDAERAGLIETAGWRAASLGPLVLRAETAALAGAVIVMNAWLR